MKNQKDQVQEAIKYCKQALIFLPVEDREIRKVLYSQIQKLEKEKNYE